MYKSIGKIARRSVLAAGIATGMAFTALTPALAADVDVTFLLVSDIYKMASKKSKRGGFARAAAVAKAERAKGGNLVYAHAGDFISPSLLSGFDKGEHVVELTNMAPPDFVVPGNHEFDHGKDVFLKRMGELKSTILSANLRRADGSKVPGIEDNAILTFGDASDPMKSVKIGFVGLTMENSPVASSPGDLVFASTLDTAKAQAKALKEQGADILVAILHEDLSVDQKLFATRKFDFVLSGHDHDLTILYDGKTLLAESREEGDIMVAIDVTFSIGEKRGKRRVKWWPKFRLIDTEDVTPDPDTAAKVASFQATLSKELDVAVGKTTSELISIKTEVRTRETKIGNLIADAMRAEVNADVALTNGGGIRGNKTYDPGTELTRRDILTELPFGNKTLLLELDGASILAAMENGVSQVEKTAGRFPHVSGMSFTYDMAMEPGKRVSKAMIGGAPLDKAKMYTLATNDYVARGGDGYKSFRNGKVLVGPLDGTLMANSVMAYLRAKGAVDAKIEGRVTRK